MSDRRFFRVGLAAVLAFGVVACGPEGEDEDAGADSAVSVDVGAIDSGSPGFPDAEENPDAEEHPDAEENSDAEEHPDAEENSDAEEHPDAEENSDAEEHADAEENSDAAEHPDAEEISDASANPDAAEPTDASENPDAPVYADAELYPDAPEYPDAPTYPDAADPTDAGDPNDAETDAGDPADASTPADTGTQTACLCPSPIQDYWGTGPNDIWALSNNKVYHWDGYAWTLPHIETPVGPPFEPAWGLSSIFGSGNTFSAVGDYVERVNGYWNTATGFVSIEWQGSIDCPASNPQIWISGGLTVIYGGGYSDITGLGYTCAIEEQSGTVTIYPPDPHPEPDTWIGNCDGPNVINRDYFVSWAPGYAAVQQSAHAECTAIGAELEEDGTYSHFPVYLSQDTSTVYARSAAGSWVALADAYLLGVPCGVPRVYAQLGTDLYSFDGTGAWVLANQDAPLLASSTFCETNDPPQPALPACGCSPRPDAGVPDAGDAGDPITMVSVTNYGVRGNWHSNKPSISADGRYVAFVSSATNFDFNDTNWSADVYIRDRQTNLTYTASNHYGECTQGMISEDGRYVELISNNYSYLRDLQSTSIVPTSLDSAGNWANANTTDVKLSPDGRFLQFISTADNLVAGDLNAVSDIFVRDLQAGVTTRVSVDSAGVEGNAASSNTNLAGAVFSADGRYVAFSSSANNLIAGDTNFSEDVFVHDRQTGTTTAVSRSSAGVLGNGFSGAPSMSADGNVVTFYSNASNLVANDTFASFDVFVHDRTTAATTRVNVSSTGVAGNGFSGPSSLSADGRFVVFTSAASNLVPGDTNNNSDVFVHDRQTATTVRVNLGETGQQGYWPTTYAVISANGRYIAFASRDELAGEDGNNSDDVFVVRNPLAP